MRLPTARRVARTRSTARSTATHSRPAPAPLDPCRRPPVSRRHEFEEESGFGRRQVSAEDARNRRSTTIGLSDPGAPRPSRGSSGGGRAACSLTTRDHPVLFSRALSLLRSAPHAGRRSHRCKPADRLGVVRSHIRCQARPARAQERASAAVQRADDLTPCLVDDLPADGSAVGFHPQRDREEAAATRDRDPTGEGPDSGDPVRDGSTSIPPTRRRRDTALGQRDARRRERGGHDDANDPCSVPVQRSPSFSTTSIHHSVVMSSTRWADNRRRRPGGTGQQRRLSARDGSGSLLSGRRPGGKTCAAGRPTEGACAAPSVDR
jgi:hypothetical protein